MNKPVLTKTCNTCGLQKPLSAFLQLGEHGARAIYGNMCSSCRKTAMEKSKQHLPKDGEGGTTSTSGHRVDAKAKVQGDINKKEARDQIKELYRKEEEKDEKIESELSLTVEKIKEHDKQKLSKLEKSSFLTAPRKPFEAKQRAEKTTQQSQQIEQSAQKEESAKQERQQKGLDFTSPFEGTRVGQEKFKSAEFRRFATLLGTGTAIGRTMGTSAAKSAKSGPDKTDKNAPASEEPLIDYIKETWKPKSGR